MHSGGITWKHNSQRLRAWIKAKRLIVDFAEAVIEHLPVNVSGQTIQDVANFSKDTANLAHVVAREREWHAGGGRNMTHVILGRLHRFTQWEGIIGKVVC